MQLHQCDQLNYKLIIGWQCRQEMGENFMDSERLKTPKMDCVLKVYTKTKNSISLDSRFVDLENTGDRATLMFSFWSEKWQSYII